MKISKKKEIIEFEWSRQKRNNDFGLTCDYMCQFIVWVIQAKFSSTLKIENTKIDKHVFGHEQRMRWVSESEEEGILPYDAVFFYFG